MIFTLKTLRNPEIVFQIPGSPNTLSTMKDVTFSHSQRKAWRGGNEKLGFLTSCPSFFRTRQIRFSLCCFMMTSLKLPPQDEGAKVFMTTKFLSLTLIRKSLPVLIVTSSYISFIGNDYILWKELNYLVKVLRKELNYLVKVVRIHFTFFGEVCLN